MKGSRRERIAECIHTFYIQDDWKIAPNFTLNIGVRYEVDTPMTEGLSDSRCTTGFECKDRLNAFDLDGINPVAGTPGVATYPDTYWDRDGDNWAPRIGFSWNVAPKTVMRGGVTSRRSSNDKISSLNPQGG